MMKNRFLLVFLVFIGAQFLGGGEVWGQCDQVVVSAPNYSVIVDVTLTKVYIQNNGCPYGYNYGVEVNYQTTFTGNPPPGLVLDNLAVTIQCSGANIGPFNLNQSPGVHTTIQGNAYYSNCNPFPPSLEDRGCSNIRVRVSESNGTGPGNDIPNTYVTVPCRSIPTPVEFLYFNSTYQTQTRSALLSWSTTKEWENSHFEIERGVNSVTEWETIGEVEGSGYSDVVQSYQFTDEALPPTGEYIYYRIKQVDFDGDFSYSATRSIKIDAIQGENQWLLYPNPSSNGSEIKILLQDQGIVQDEKIRITLSNAFGQAKHQEVNHPHDVASTVNSWLTNSGNGLFVLQIQWGSTSHSLKIIRN